MAERRATSDTTVNPMAEQQVDDVESGQNTRQSAADDKRAGARHQLVQDGVSLAVLARIGAAPTNWHQATVYFLTSTSKEDAGMRKRAPLMYAASVAMVLLQTFAVFGMLSGMLHPSCVSNEQCANMGYFCHISPSDSLGRCRLCGESPPLVPYRSDTEIYADSEDDDKFKEYNEIRDLSYPHSFVGKRARTYDYVMDGVFNFSMVNDRCTPPLRSLHWDYTVGENDDGVRTYSIDRGNMGEWPPTSQIRPQRTRTWTHWTVESVAKWCDACVQRNGGIDVGDGLRSTDSDTGLSVSIMNRKLLAQTAVDAMHPFDWIALGLCSCIVGLQIVGEIKDTQLCEMAMARHLQELSPSWRFALNLLNRLRSQLFLSPLMGAIPGVVLTQGGSALLIAFNTIAILFITDVDNLAYAFGLGERQRERVDTYGYVFLTDREAVMFSRTKLLCITTTVIYTFYMVWNGASVGAILSGGIVPAVFKLSELASTYKTKTEKEIAAFIMVTLGTQFACMGVMMLMLLQWYRESRG